MPPSWGGALTRQLQQTKCLWWPEIVGNCAVTVNYYWKAYFSLREGQVGPEELTLQSQWGMLGNDPGAFQGREG